MLRAFGWIAVASIAVVFAACSLTIPSDDQLRGQPGGGGGSSGAEEGGLGGTWVTGGAGPGPLGDCASNTTWITLAQATNGDVSAPLLVARASQNDLVAAWLEAGRAWMRPIGANAEGGAAVALSSGSGATRLAIAWNDTSTRLGAVWKDSTLSFSSVDTSGAVQSKPLYSADPLEPAGKSPEYAAIAPRSSGGFGIVWRGYADSHERLFGVITDADGNNQTGGETYTRLTDGQCGHRKNPALIATSGGFALAWPWTATDCGDTGWNPDVQFALLDDTVAPPSAFTGVAAADGVSDHPALATDGADHGVAWLDDREGKTHVWFARISGTTVAPNSARRISEGAATVDRAPSIAAAPAGFGVAWQTDTTIQLTVVDKSGTIQNVTVATGAVPNENAALVWDGARWVVAWVGVSAGLRQLHVTYCTP